MTIPDIQSLIKSRDGLLAMIDTDEPRDDVALDLINTLIEEVARLREGVTGELFSRAAAATQRCHERTAEYDYTGAAIQAGRSEALVEVVGLITGQPVVGFE